MPRMPRGGLATLVGASLLLSGTSCTWSPASPAPSPSASPSQTPSPSASPSQTRSSSHSTGDLSAVPGIVTEVESSVVTVLTSGGLGSGVVYRSDGTIVTDAHVVEDGQKRPFASVQVQFADGTRSDAAVVAVDDATDVGVIKAARSDLPAARFSTGPPVVGQLTVVIGSPLGLADTVTAGIVSGLHRNMPPTAQSPQGILDLIQTDAPISPGNSGGAAVDAQARVIGLSEAYLPPSTGAVAIGFVTPSQTVTDVADQLLKNGVARHAFLGVVPADISPQVAERFQLSTTEGALVIGVAQGGPAARAGIKVGDIVTRFGRAKVTDVTDLLAALRKQDPGDRVDVTVERNGAGSTVSVTLSDTASRG